MKASIRVAAKVYFRSLLYIAIMVILGCVTNFYLVKLAGTAVSLAEFHLGALKLGIIGYVAFCCLSYEYLSKASLCGAKETIGSICGGEAKLAASQFIVLLVILLVWYIRMIFY